MIFVIRQQSDSLEVFFDSPEFISLQGFDFTADNKKMLVADYSRGIFAIDFASKQLTLLPPLEGATLLSVDGLYRYQGGFIAIQNGINPRRVVRLDFNDDYSKIEKLTTLCANHTEFNDPSLGVIVGDEFYYSANGQWDAYDDDGIRVPTKGTQAHVILKIKL